jgi:DNA-binding NarL/FixJ family response regulator
MLPALRILIVSDNLLARAGLAALLADRGDCLIVGQTTSGDLLIADTELYQPDIVLLDLGWNVTHNQRTLDLLATVELPVLALASDEQDSAVLLRHLQPFSAYGLLLNQTEPDLLVHSLQLVSAGLVVLDPVFAATLPFPAATGSPENLQEDLTTREIEVLQLLAQGMTNKGIAHQLGITDHTVKFHVNAIMTKLDAQSRTDAVVRATRAGLLLL